MDTYVAKLGNGRVEVWAINSGALKRAIYVSAIFAQVSGDTVQITRPDNSIEVYSIENGSKIRVIR